MRLCLQSLSQLSICSANMLLNQMPTTSLMRSQPSSRHNFAERPISLNITRTLTCQPQRIHPPRRVQGVPVPIEPTRQLARIRRQIAASLGIVVAVAVVVQAAFGVEVLALEAQRLFQLFAAAVLEFGELAVAVVARRPDDLAAEAGQFLGRAQVVEVVVERAGLEAFAVEHRQRAEGAGFVDVAAVVARAVFGDDLVALPEKIPWSGRPRSC